MRSAATQEQPCWPRRPAPRGGSRRPLAVTRLRGGTPSSPGASIPRLQSALAHIWSRSMHRTIGSIGIIVDAHRRRGIPGARCPFGDARRARAAVGPARRSCRPSAGEPPPGGNRLDAALRTSTSRSGRSSQPGRMHARSVAAGVCAEVITRTPAARGGPPDTERPRLGPGGPTGGDHHPSLGARCRATRQALHLADAQL